MATWVCPRRNDASRQAANRAAQHRWVANVAGRSGLATGPLDVTTNRARRRSTAATSERAYSGAETADIAMPAVPEEPRGSCGLTLWRRFHRYRPTWAAAASPYSISHTRGSMCSPEAPSTRNSAQDSAPSIQLTAVIG